MKTDKRKQRKTKIGGQAVIEGIMMRGERSMALAVRDQQGNIRIDTTRLPAKKPWYSKVPFLRGVINLVVTMIAGFGIIGKSADVFAEEDSEQLQKQAEKQKKADKKAKKSKKSNIVEDNNNNGEQSGIEVVNDGTQNTTKQSRDSKKVDKKDSKQSQGLGGLMFLSVVLGLAFAIALFVVLPTYATTWIMRLFKIEQIQWARSLIEGGLKLLIFIMYLVSITLMKDIKRVFMYHGAEHMTIACYESGQELTVENVSKCSRYHDRCGTSFLVFVLVLSIALMFAVEAICYAVGFEQINITWVRTLIKIAMLPLTAGVSYEFLMLLAKTNFFLFVPFKWFGKQFQRLTTRKPDDKMCEVAIVAFNSVLQMDNDNTIPERHWLMNVPAQELEQYLVSDCKARGIDTQYAHRAVTDIKELQPDAETKEGVLKASVVADFLAKWEEISKKPYEYIVGIADFYGKKFFVDSNTLIPRPETELVTEQAIINTPDNSSVLDLCCGSGVIGLTIAMQKPSSNVTLADISDKALNVAKKNAEKHKLNVEIKSSDMFNNLNGKFDTIVINPPYIESSVIPTLDSSVKDYEPLSALDGGQDGLDFYRIIADKAGEFLNDNGTLVLEIGYNQGETVPELLKECGWKDVVMKKDYSGNARIVIAKKP